MIKKTKSFICTATTAVACLTALYAGVAQASYCSNQADTENLRKTELNKATAAAKGVYKKYASQQEAYDRALAAYKDCKDQLDQICRTTKESGYTDAQTNLDKGTVAAQAALDKANAAAKKTYDDTVSALKTSLSKASDSYLTCVKR